MQQATSRKAMRLRIVESFSWLVIDFVFLVIRSRAGWLPRSTQISACLDNAVLHPALELDACVIEAILLNVNC